MIKIPFGSITAFIIISFPFRAIGGEMVLVKRQNFTEKSDTKI